MKFLSVTICALLTAGWLAAVDTAPSNLKVLEYKTVEETKQHMKVISKALDVKCKFCHNLDNFASDEKNHKTISRDMMKMTKAVNMDFLTWKDADKVTCWTCHRGKKEPEKK